MKTLTSISVGIVLAVSRCAAESAPPITVAVGRLPVAPLLDGKLADWPTNATTFVLGETAQTVGRPGRWGGTTDSCAAVRLAWDATNLYLAADVTDDRLLQAVSPAEIWQGDTLELFFHTQPGAQRVAGFRQVALVPPLETGAVLRVTGPQGDFTNATGAVVTRATGYTLECRIPWENFPNFTPTNGARLGCQVMVDDRDDKGRKSQLCWYPSALTFTQPTHMNELVLRDQGQPPAVRVLAGPNAACVTDPRQMPVSVVADISDAATATITPGPVTVDLKSTGERLRTGRIMMDVTGREGLQSFVVTVNGTNGNVLATTRFTTQLVGARYVRVKELTTALTMRLKELQQRPELDPAAVAGVAAWLGRQVAFLNNEAQPQTVTPILLDQIFTELTALETAVAKLAGGQDPYAGLIGSFVRAYRSPLTGQYRPYALFVPPQVAPGAPLLVFLHAIFADERQLALLTPQIQGLGAIVVQAAAYRQFDWSGVSAAETWAGLADLKQHYQIDDDRVALFGYHNGGRGVWQLAMGRPDLWSAAAPLFSGIDTRPPYPALRLYPEHYASASNAQIPWPHFKPPLTPVPITGPLERKVCEKVSLVSPLENILHLPLHSAYGEDDPDAAAERLAMQERFRTLGAPLTTRYQPGAMHGGTPLEISDPAFFKWLLAQRRHPPRQFTFVAPNLRDNHAWWVTVEALLSPAENARVEAGIEADRVQLRTTNVAALALDLTKLGRSAQVVLDGQPALPLAGQFVRAADGRWRAGQPSPGMKRHGLSGPLDDFQFDRFLFVYGTTGTAAENALLAKLGKKLSDWGLGATFNVKADRDVTDADLREAHLIVIGTPSSNSLLGRLAKDVPLVWSPTGLHLGKVSVAGAGAGACLIYPNPLAPERYLVILTGVDEAGYQVWNTRAPGGDYVLGRTETHDEKPVFVPTIRGWFDNHWSWSADLCYGTVFPERVF